MLLMIYDVGKHLVSLKPFNPELNRRRTLIKTIWLTRPGKRKATHLIPQK